MCTVGAREAVRTRTSLHASIIASRRCGSALPVGVGPATGVAMPLRTRNMERRVRACLENQKGAADVVLPHPLDEQSAVFLSIDPATTRNTASVGANTKQAVRTRDQQEQCQEEWVQATLLRPVI